MSRDQVYRHGCAQGSVIAVLNGSGKLVMESIVETKASSILQFIHGLHGELHVTWEEGTWASWRYDLLKPHVPQVLVCDPRRNALLKEGNKSDKIDASKLADLLRTGMLRPVYHGEHGLRTLRELGRSYQTISQDLNRVMNRIKALYRGWSIPCAGTQVYAPLNSAEVAKWKWTRRARTTSITRVVSANTSVTLTMQHDGQEILWGKAARAMAAVW